MTSGYPLIALLGWLALALGAGLLDDGREKRLAAVGLACLGLGLAAWRVVSPDSGGPLAPPADLGPGFLVVNGGLLLLGIGLLVWAVGSAGRCPRRAAALVATMLGVLLITGLSAASLLAAGLVGAAGSAGALGLAGAGMLVLGRAVGSTGPARALGRRFFLPPLRPTPAGGRHGRWAAAAMGAGIAATALGPHVAVVFLGVTLTLWSAFFLFHARGARPVPFTPLLSLLLLPTYWLLATVAGEGGLRMAALPLVPLSPAAEWLIASALLLVGWASAGLWPLHRQVPGAFTALSGAMLLSRVAFPLAPGGLEYWRPLVVPLLILAIWHAAAHARWPPLAAGAALLGVAGLTPAGTVGAGWLMGSALLLELSSLGWLSGGLARAGRLAAWVAGAWGGLLVLEGGLRGEVVYTAFGTAVLALLVLAGSRHAMIASAPSTPSPRA